MKSMFTKAATMALVLLGSVAFAGTTGNISGTVSDSNGDPLPGVTILLASSNLIGTRTAVTDAQGKYRSVFLPPGVYEVTATFTGFRTQKATVRVEIDGNHSVDLTMEVQNSIEDELVVVADLPVIDHQSTTAGSNISEDFFTKVPTGRVVSSIMELAPGVTDTDVDGSFRVNGASGPENQYIIDGVNTTSIDLGGESANLNFDFIQEVQVKTGGYNAEFGRATGGILNVITKSGGNEFEGSVYAFADRRNQVASARQTGVFGSTALGTDRDDFGITVGGPIIKDKLWFFFGVNPQERKSYNSVESQSPIQDGDGVTTWADWRGTDELVTIENEVTAWAGKLTWQLNESNTVVLSGNTDPGEVTFRDVTATAGAGDLFRDYDTKNYILKWNSILNNVFTLDVSYSIHEENRTEGSADGSNHSQIWNRFANDGSEVGGVGYYDIVDAKRNDFNVKIGAYLGNHDLKAGIQYEETNFSNARDYTGLGSTRADFVNGTILVQTFGQADADGNISRISPQFASTDNEYTAFFIQDSWSVTPNLVVNLGVRDEVQTLLDSNGNTYHDFDDNFAPRLGFTWDFTGDGRSKLYGHYGRFFQSLPMDINNRAAAPEIIHYRWYEFNADTPTNILEWNDSTIQDIIDAKDPYGELGFGSGSTSIDPNAKATNHDEIILGVEYEFKTDWTVGFKYVSREMNEIIEDISFDAGDNYIIGNPGEDVTFTNNNASTLEFYDFQGDFHTVAPGEEYTLAAGDVGFPKPSRDYNGYEFLLRKAYRDDYQFQLTYVHSSTRGNYVGSTVPSGQVDPGITALFDIPSTTVNATGLLPQHRRHNIKFDGSYEFDFGLLLGASYRYTSGAGYDALGEPDTGNGAYSEFHLIERGSAGQLPALTSIDLKVDYTMKFSGKMSLSLYADIFNVFNFQEATAVSRDFTDHHVTGSDLSAPWNEGLDPINTGDDHTDEVLYANRYYQWVEGRFNSVNDLIQYYESNGLEWNADTFGKPTNFQLGRRTRFGARFRF